MSRPRIHQSHRFGVSFSEASRIVEAALVMGKAAQLARCPESLWNSFQMTVTVRGKRNQKLEIIWPWLGGPMAILSEILSEILLLESYGEATFMVDQPSAHEALAAITLVTETLQRTGMSETMIADLLDLSDI